MVSLPSLLLLERCTHTRDEIKGQYSVQGIKYIMWLISRNPRTKDLHQGLTLFRTNPRCSTLEISGTASILPLKLLSKGICATWRQPPQPSFWSLGLLRLPLRSLPRTRSRVSSPTIQPPTSAPTRPSPWLSYPGFLMVCVARCGGSLHPSPHAARWIFLYTKLTCHFPAKSSQWLLLTDRIKI